MGRSIIVYFSHRGENYCSGNIRKLEVGNTEVVAELIKAETGADSFRLETVEAYPENYKACTEAAMKELRAKARPALKAMPSGLSSYDTVYLGYPNWWGTMPMAIFTFLENSDLKGKTILPFCTHEGSGMGNSERDLRSACPDSVIGTGLAVHGTYASSAVNAVKGWLRKNGR